MATCPASFITPMPPAGLGWAVVTPSQHPPAWMLNPACPQGPVLWHRGLEQQLCRGSTQLLLGEQPSNAVPSVRCSTQLFLGTSESQAREEQLSPAGDDAETQMGPSVGSQDAQGW